MRVVTTAEGSRTTPRLSISGGVFKKRLLLLGSGRLATELCEVLGRKGRVTREIVGAIDANPLMIGAKVHTTEVVGTYTQLFEIVEKYHVQVIAVCLEDRRMALPTQALLEFKSRGLEIVDGHHLYEEESGRLSIDLIRPSALIFSSGFRRRRVSMWTKQVIDYAFAVGGLLVCSLLFVIVAALIKLDSPGPVFYRQMRVGLRGQPYMIWKFRSMRSDAEKSGPRWAETNDPRISRVGKWLRMLRIDELPQLINILRGEMSLVGPRPERPVFVQELRTIIPYYDIRHSVLPGLTGWAQTQFRYGASEQDSHVKLQYDLYYVKNMCFALDLRIIITTVRVVLWGEGAR